LFRRTKNAMSKVAPEPETMDRMAPPPIIANLTFGGTILVQEWEGQQRGMICSPAGMFTSQKCMQACCCPSCLHLDFTYVTGSDDKAVSVETKPASCLQRMQPHYTVSLKDYTKLAEDKHSQSHIESLRKRGKSDAEIAKIYPKKVLVGQSRKKGSPEGCGCPCPKSYKNNGAKGCAGMFYASWGVKMPEEEGGGDAFYVKNKGQCCKVCTECPACDNCSQFVKGNICMQYKVPIYDSKETVVAYVVQTTPLIPTTCCTADPGPTIQMAIHKADPSRQFSEEDLARLSLFMFSLRPNVPGGGGGPYFIQKISNMFLYKAGWLLGYYQSDVKTEYLTIKQAFNAEIAGFGDIMEKIRGK
jgi:hypothetical protein